MNRMQKLSTRTKAAGLTASLLLLTTLGCENSAYKGAESLSKDVEVSVERWPEVQSPPLDPEIDRRASALLAKMTLEEKVGQIMQAEIQSLEPGDVQKYHLGSVLNGGGSFPYRKERAPVSDWLKLADDLYAESMDDSDGYLAIPVIWGTDAVHGHNNVTGSVLFPHNIGLGAAHDRTLLKEIGAATAEMVRATGIDWVFAPTLAVAQNDRWGRTYESYSETPELVATYAEAMVEGLQGEVGDPSFVQGRHVLACAKHFLGDGGTAGGDDQGDARIDEDTLVRIHNAGYPPAIAAGVQTVMASFSSWNGEKLHGHKYLLTDVLKDRMGFKGFVVGDWNGHGQVPGCTNESCAQAINAGVDLVMVPNDWRALYANTLDQVKDGTITMERLDDAVLRILRVKVVAGLFDGNPSSRIPAGVGDSIGSPEHRELAREAVRKSLVLLKNNNGVLPLNPNLNILVTGASANDVALQSGGWSVTWQGTDVTNDDFPGATTIYQGIADAVTAAGGRVELSETGDYKNRPDVAIVVYGEEPYAEGIGDRNTLEFEPGDKQSLALLKKLKAQQIPVVSVFLSGRPMWVNPEINASDAFVAAWLPGTEGNGVADVLFTDRQGDVQYDFQGRLSFSWPSLPLQDEVNGPNYQQQPLFALGYGQTYRRAKPLYELPEEVAGLTVNDAGDIVFFNGRPHEPWTLFIRSPEHRQRVSGAFNQLPRKDVTVQTSDKDVQEDALKFSWRDTWSAGLTFLDAPPFDLSRFADTGLLAFDLKINDFSEASLNIEMHCGEACVRKVDLSQYAEKNLGNGWQPVVMNLSCFKREGDDFKAMVEPFAIDAGGKGEIEVANIRFLEEGKANFECPVYEDLSTTPAPHEVYWTREWWAPRHEALVERMQQGGVDLLMIGDSITEGWANEGKTVWTQYYGDRNAVNLGFGGDRTEHVLWRLQNGEVDGINPKVAVLMIGTNNTGHRFEKPEETFEGIQAVVAELQKRLPETKILLLGIFPRDAEPNSPMRQLNEQVNAMVADWANGQPVEYLNINQAFLTDQGILTEKIMPDLLHLSAEGYAIWAKEMEPKLKAMMTP